MSIYDIKTGVTQVIGEKPVDLSPSEVIQICEIFPTTTISQNVFEEVVQKDKNLQTVVQQVIKVNPAFQNVKPTSVVIDKYGSKSVITMTYEKKNVVVESDSTTGQTTILETYSLPETIKPVVYETSTLEGTLTVVTNTVEKITEKEPAMPQILSDIKIKVPELMTESIQGIKLEEHKGIEKIHIVTKSGSGEDLQISVVYDTATKETILMDVRTLTHQEIATKPKEVVKVKLSQEEIVEEKIEQIITSTSAVTKIPGVKQIIKAEETVTGYGKIFDVVMQGTDGKKYIVKTETIEGNAPQIIDVVLEQPKPQPEICTEESVDKNTGIIFTHTNNLTMIAQDRYYPKWTQYLENQYQVMTKGFQIESQTTSKLQRTNEYNVRYTHKETKECKEFRLTVDRTGKITMLEEKNIPAAESHLPTMKSSIEIVESQVAEAIREFPVVSNSIKILQSADYTFENKTPKKVFIYAHKTQFEVVLIFQSPSDPTKMSRVVLMAELEAGTSLRDKTKIPKILDISLLPTQIESTYTKNVFDSYGRSIIVSNDIQKMSQTTRYTSMMGFASSHLPAIANAEVEQVETINFALAVQYKTKLYNGVDTMEIIVSEVKGSFVLVDFRIESVKSTIEKIPIKEIQAVKTVIRPEEYTRADVVVVKQEIIKELKTKDITIKQITVGENQRVNIFTVDVVTPDQAVKQVIAVRSTEDDVVKIV